MEREFAAFGTLDNPDVYFEYAPNLYPGRKGAFILFLDINLSYALSFNSDFYVFIVKRKLNAE